MNGRKSQQFEIGSGVAQGCPLSPLLFLFIGEPLTRLVLKERELKGVNIGEHEHKVGQFADDTAAMLEGYEQLENLFEIIKMGESYYRDGMQQSQDGNNTDGGNKTKRSARNTAKRTQATEPERGTIRNILGRPNRVRQDKIRRICLLYTSPSPRDGLLSRMPSSA